jgi:hypothetical protein
MYTIDSQGSAIKARRRSKPTKAFKELWLSRNAPPIE